MSPPLNLFQHTGNISLLHDTTPLDMHIEVSRRHPFDDVDLGSVKLPYNSRRKKQKNISKPLDCEPTLPHRKEKDRRCAHNNENDCFMTKGSRWDESSSKNVVPSRNVNRRNSCDGIERLRNPRRKKSKRRSRSVDVAPILPHHDAIIGSRWVSDGVGDDSMEHKGSRRDVLPTSKSILSRKRYPLRPSKDRTEEDVENISKETKRRQSVNETSGDLSKTLDMLECSSELASDDDEQTPESSVTCIDSLSPRLKPRRSVTWDERNLETTCSSRQLPRRSVTWDGSDMDNFDPIRKVSRRNSGDGVEAVRISHKHKKNTCSKHPDDTENTLSWRNIKGDRCVVGDSDNDSGLDASSTPKSSSASSKGNSHRLSKQGTNTDEPVDNNACLMTNWQPSMDDDRSGDGGLAMENSHPIRKVGRSNSYDDIEGIRLPRKHKRKKRSRSFDDTEFSLLSVKVDRWTGIVNDDSMDKACHRDVLSAPKRMVSPRRSSKKETNTDMLKSDNTPVLYKDQRPSVNDKSGDLIKALETLELMDCCVSDDEQKPERLVTSGNNSHATEQESSRCVTLGARNLATPCSSHQPHRRAAVTQDGSAPESLSSTRKVGRSNSFDGVASVRLPRRCKKKGRSRSVDDMENKPSERSIKGGRWVDECKTPCRDALSAPKRAVSPRRSSNEEADTNTAMPNNNPMSMDRRPSANNKSGDLIETLETPDMSECSAAEEPETPEKVETSCDSHATGIKPRRCVTWDESNLAATCSRQKLPKRSATWDGSAQPIRNITRRNSSDGIESVRLPRRCKKKNRRSRSVDDTEITLSQRKKKGGRVCDSNDELMDRLSRWDVLPAPKNGSSSNSGAPLLSSEDGTGIAKVLLDNAPRRKERQPSLCARNEDIIRSLEILN